VRRIERLKQRVKALREELARCEDRYFDGWEVRRELEQAEEQLDAAEDEAA